METAMIHFDAHAIMIDKIFNQKQFNGYMIDENSVDENVWFFFRWINCIENVFMCVYACISIEDSIINDDQIIEWIMFLTKTKQQQQQHLQSINQKKNLLWPKQQWKQNKKNHPWNRINVWWILYKKVNVDTHTHIPWKTGR